MEKERRSSHGFGRNCVRENGGEMKKNRRYIEREREEGCVRVREKRRGIENFL